METGGRSEGLEEGLTEFHMVKIDLRAAAAGNAAAISMQEYHKYCNWCVV